VNRRPEARVVRKEEAGTRSTLQGAAAGLEDSSNSMSAGNVNLMLDNMIPIGFAEATLVVHA
jgi:hypothetical protein